VTAAPIPPTIGGHAQRYAWQWEIGAMKFRDSTVLTPAFANTMKEYAQLHHKIRSGELPPRFLVVNWIRGSHGGYGDRLKEIINAFYAALLTNRAFVMHESDNAARMDTYFYSPWIDWTVPPGMDNLPSKTYNWMDNARGNSPPATDLPTSSIDPNVPVVTVILNTPTWAYWAKALGAHAEALGLENVEEPFWGTESNHPCRALREPYRQSGGLILRALLQPKPVLHNAVTSLENAARRNGECDFLLCAHLRLGGGGDVPWDDPSFMSSTDVADKYLARIQPLVDVFADKVPGQHCHYLASDSASAFPLWSAWFNGTDTSQPQKSVHVAKSPASDVAAAWLSILAEHHLLADRCDYTIACRSGFSRSGMWRRIAQPYAMWRTTCADQDFWQVRGAIGIPQWLDVKPLLPHIP